MVSFSVGTRSPVLLSSIISGIPPAFVAMIGRFEIMASRLTKPNASLTDGRTKKSALFMSCGMFLRCPSRITWFCRLRFSMSFSRASRWCPSPAITKRRLSAFFAGSWARRF